MDNFLNCRGDGGEKAKLRGEYIFFIYLIFYLFYLPILFYLSIKDMVML